MPKARRNAAAEYRRWPRADKNSPVKKSDILYLMEVLFAVLSGKTKLSFKIPPR